MKVLLINLEFDCAGVGWNLRNALNKVPGWLAKMVSSRATVAAPNADLFFTDVDQVVKMAEEFDILHFNNWIWSHKPGSHEHYAGWDLCGGDHPFDGLVGKKQFVLHFHRGLLQYDPIYWEAECKKMEVKLIKCDPLAPLKGATWIPNILDLAGVLPHTVPYADPMAVAVYGSLFDSRRTNPGIKVALEYQGINHRFFDGVPKEECYKLRRDYNVSIDNLTQGFIGMWGWESLAMGQALLAHLEPETVDAYASVFGEAPPIMHCANIDFVGYYLREFRQDAAWFEQLGLLSSQWVHKCYLTNKIVRMYTDFYEGKP